MLKHHYLSLFLQSSITILSCFQIIFATSLVVPNRNISAAFRTSAWTFSSLHTTILYNNNGGNGNRSPIEDDYKLDKESPNVTSSNISRETFLVGSAIGGIAYSKLVFDTISKIQQRGNDIYPESHESRVRKTFETAIVKSFEMKQIIENPIEPSQNRLEQPFRILEVGIGSKCRTIVRGLYDDAFRDLQHQCISKKKGFDDQMGSCHSIDLIGIDNSDMPKEDSLHKVTDKLSSFDIPISFRVQKGDLTQKLPFPDGYFDVILSSFVLCSVTDPYKSVNEIKRLLNPKGGTFGYIEHVAVNDEEKRNSTGRSLLELQQRIFDPLQQVVADNCHLHRNTESIIGDTFGINMSDLSSISSSSSTVLVENERFFVDDMWPVSCQCRGVIVMNS